MSRTRQPTWFVASNLSSCHADAASGWWRCKQPRGMCWLPWYYVSTRRGARKTGFLSDSNGGKISPQEKASVMVGKSDLDEVEFQVPRPQTYQTLGVIYYFI